MFLSFQSFQAVRSSKEVRPFCHCPLTLEIVHQVSWSLVARSIILAIIFSAAMSSIIVIRTLDSSVMSTKLFGYFALIYLCWYSCRCWLTTLIVARVHVTLTARIKIIGEPSLVFTGLRFGFIRLPSKKYKIMSWKKKEFEDVKDLVLFGCLLKNTRLCNRRRKSLKTLKICSFLLEFIL
jgi:hypothetical protein